ncbi:MAG: LuxR C-terminal-related transcriptional regulator [Rikenellaceae bacterium]
MARRRLHILISDPSMIIRRGVISVLLEIETLSLEISEVASVEQLGETIEQRGADIVIVNPLHLGITSLGAFRVGATKFVALQSVILGGERLDEFDAVISVADDTETIEHKLQRLISTKERRCGEELSHREREIVRAIALGQSNKEIADGLCISTHTVMTHRKNIAAKLQIRNPAGLTIYAIVNKLIDIDEV